MLQSVGTVINCSTPFLARLKQAFILSCIGEDELVPTGNKSSVDGWHTIQFSGGKDAPTSFALTLLWKKNSTRWVKGNTVPPPLLKLRTDFNRLTPKAERVISKLPSWCSLFGKSTSPYTLAFLTALPVNIQKQNLERIFQKRKVSLLFSYFMVHSTFILTSRIVCLIHCSDVNQFK